VVHHQKKISRSLRKFIRVKYFSKYFLSATKTSQVAKMYVLMGLSTNFAEKNKENGRKPKNAISSAKKELSRERIQLLRGGESESGRAGRYCLAAVAASRASERASARSFILHSVSNAPAVRENGCCVRCGAGA